MSTVGRDDIPLASSAPRASGGRLGVPLAASAGPHGQVAIAAGVPGTGRATLVQGRAGGPFSTLAVAGGAAAPLALSTAYLGDLALAAPARGGLGVHVERYFARAFVREAVAGPPPGCTGAVSLAMDYRSDALAVWTRGAAIYARDLPASGVVHPIQRLAPAATGTALAALLSDDNRAIVAWSQTRAGRTSVYLDRSRTGVRFGAPQLLESFAAPAGPAPTRSPILVRLSSESVMLAWAGVQDGRWVVRVAPVDLLGVQRVTTLGDTGGDALLAGLAAGPDGDALALWTEPQGPGGGQAILAARGIDSYPGRAIFGVTQEVAAPGPVADPGLALDPASDRAVVAWRGTGGAIEYSLGPREQSP